MTLALLFVASALNQLQSCSFICRRMQPGDIMQVIVVLQVIMMLQVYMVQSFIMA